MQGLLGYTYEDVTYDIFLRHSMTRQQLNATCAHEHLHDLGIGEENHDWIYHFEDQLADPLCTKLIHRLNDTTAARRTTSPT